MLLWCAPLPSGLLCAVMWCAIARSADIVCACANSQRTPGTGLYEPPFVHRKESESGPLFKPPMVFKSETYQGGGNLFATAVLWLLFAVVLRFGTLRGHLHDSFNSLSNTKHELGDPTAAHSTVQRDRAGCADRFQTQTASLASAADCFNQCRNSVWHATEQGHPRQGTCGGTPVH